MDRVDRDLRQSHRVKVSRRPSRPRHASPVARSKVVWALGVDHCLTEWIKMDDKPFLVGGFEPWNFMTFHSVGNFIIPTVTQSIIFQRGRAQPPTRYLFMGWISIKLSYFGRGFTGYSQPATFFNRYRRVSPRNCRTPKGMIPGQKQFGDVKD